MELFSCEHLLLWRWRILWRRRHALHVRQPGEVGLFAHRASSKKKPSTVGVFRRIYACTLLVARAFLPYYVMIFMLFGIAWCGVRGLAYHSTEVLKTRNAPIPQAKCCDQITYAYNIDEGSITQTDLNNRLINCSYILDRGHSLLEVDSCTSY